MKLLLAVKSCERDVRRGYHTMLRETWAKDVRGADVRMFVGHGACKLASDEVRVDAGDEYLELPHKTRAIARWSVDNGYDFTFLCDTDTYLVPDRLLASGFRDFDLYGLFNGEIGRPYATENKWAWISGGVGYWLSQRAAELVAQRDPNHWAEDCYVGQVLGPEFAVGRMTAKNDGGYGWHHDKEPYRCSITKHYCAQGMRREFDVQWMALHYKYNVLERR